MRARRNHRRRAFADELFAHRDLLRHDLPRLTTLLGRSQRLREPRFLLGAEQRAGRIKQLRAPEFLRGRFRAGAIGEQTQAEAAAIVQLPRTADVARVDQDDAGQLAPIERAIEPHSIWIRPANGHPIEIGLRRRRHSIGVRPFAALVVLRAGCGRVVGDLVIVPDRRDRLRRAQREEVGVRVILPVAAIIIVERDDLVIRIEGAAGERQFGSRVLVVPIFVNVVAGVQHEIDVLARGKMAVSVEIAEAVIGARNEADA